jgi:hypothetical protein
LLDFFSGRRIKQVNQGEANMILSDPRVHADWLEENGKSKESMILRKLAACYPDKTTIVLLKEIDQLKMGQWQPRTMIHWLARIGELDERRARLFACWCVRQIWHRLEDSRSRNAVEVAERYAEGKASKKELVAAGKAATFENENSISAARAEVAARQAARYDLDASLVSTACVYAVARNGRPAAEADIIAFDMRRAQMNKIRELWNDSILDFSVDGSSE